MSDVTRILSDIERGDPVAAEQLLPLVYDELRRLAAHKLAREPSGLTLQATALVHEAYLRLVNADANRMWASLRDALGGESPLQIECGPARLRGCLLYTSPSPRDPKTSRMPSSA